MSIEWGDTHLKINIPEKDLLDFVENELLESEREIICKMFEEKMFYPSTCRRLHTIRKKIDTKFSPHLKKTLKSLRSHGFIQVKGRSGGGFIYGLTHRGIDTYNIIKNISEFHEKFVTCRRDILEYYNECTPIDGLKIVDIVPTKIKDKNNYKKIKIFAEYDHKAECKLMCPEIHKFNFLAGINFRNEYAEISCKIYGKLLVHKSLKRKPFRKQFCLNWRDKDVLYHY